MAEGEGVGATAESGKERISSVPPSLRAAWGGSADRYGALIEAADDAIVVADFDKGLIIEANPAASELFGFSLTEFLEMPVRRLHFGEDADVDRVMDEIARRERAWHPNLKSKRKDGTSFWAELRAKAFESGGQKLVLFIVRDVTHRVDK